MGLRARRRADRAGRALARPVPPGRAAPGHQPGRARARDRPGRRGPPPSSSSCCSPPGPGARLGGPGRLGLLLGAARDALGARARPPGAGPVRGRARALRRARRLAADAPAGRRPDPSVRRAVPRRRHGARGAGHRSRAPPVAALSVDGLLVPPHLEPAEVGALARALAGYDIEVLVAPRAARPRRAGHSGDASAGHPAAAPRRGSAAPGAVRTPAARTAAPRGVAILGTRGIPAAYGGFETFAEQLALRFVDRGTPVTVYCRPALRAAGEPRVEGVRLVTLPDDPQQVPRHRRAHGPVRRAPGPDPRSARRPALQRRQRTGRAVPAARRATGRAQRRRPGVAPREVGRRSAGPGTGWGSGCRSARPRCW